MYEFFIFNLQTYMLPAGPVPQTLLELIVNLNSSNNNGNNDNTINIVIINNNKSLQDSAYRPV